MHIDKMRFQNNMSNGYTYIFFFWEMSNGYGSSNVPITRVGLIILFDWFVWTVIYFYFKNAKHRNKNDLLMIGQ